MATLVFEGLPMAKSPESALTPNDPDKNSSPVGAPTGFPAALELSHLVSFVNVHMVVRVIDCNRI